MASGGGGGSSSIFASVLSDKRQAEGTAGGGSSSSIFGSSDASDKRLGESLTSLIASETVSQGRDSPVPAAARPGDVWPTKVLFSEALDAAVGVGDVILSGRESKKVKGEEKQDNDDMDAEDTDDFCCEGVEDLFEDLPEASKNEMMVRLPAA